MEGFYADRKALAAMALSTHKGEPCRICGKLIGNDENPVYAGYSSCNTTRSAHGDCWNNMPAKKDWAFPND